MEVFFKDQLYSGSKSTWYSEENNENLLSDFQKFLDANHGEHILCFFSLTALNRNTYQYIRHSCTYNLTGHA